MALHGVQQDNSHYHKTSKTSWVSDRSHISNTSRGLRPLVWPATKLSAMMLIVMSCLLDQQFRPHRSKSWHILFGHTLYTEKFNVASRHCFNTSWVSNRTRDHIRKTFLRHFPKMAKVFQRNFFYPNSRRLSLCYQRSYSFLIHVCVN